MLFSLIILAGGLLFTSCENFMNTEDVRKEIQDAIAYNNALSCDIIFRMNADVGEFLGSVDRTMREGYKTEVQFEINVNDYAFDTLQAVSQEDKTTSRADYVTIKELERDDKKGKYKYEITLEKFAKDILIQPIYKKRPKIDTILPLSSNTPVNQDTSIVISFTNPIDPESFETLVVFPFMQTKT